VVKSSSEIFPIRAGVKTCCAVSAAPAATSDLFPPHLLISEAAPSPAEPMLLSKFRRLFVSEEFP
jgi:hypothetical protein